MPHPKLILITGTDLRHEYVQNRIHREFPIHTAIYEEHVYPEGNSHSEDEESAWNWFFDRRKRYEAEIFVSANSPVAPSPPHAVLLPAGTLNSQKTFDHLEQIGPDLILLFDTSMVKEPILSRYAEKIWNLHVGLSDHYRGSSCNFWPIYDRRLDCLGATILRIDAGIDTGAVLAQQTICVEPGDTEQTLIGKTIILGAELMLETLRNWKRGDLAARPLTERGALFQKKDFQPSAVLKVKQWVESPDWQEAIQQFSRKGS